MNLPLVVQILEPEEQLPTDDSDVNFRESAGFQLTEPNTSVQLERNDMIRTDEIETGSTGEILHHCTKYQRRVGTKGAIKLTDPELPALEKASVVPRNPFGVAVGEVSDLELNFGDVIVRIFEIDAFDRYRSCGREMNPTSMKNDERVRRREKRTERTL